MLFPDVKLEGSPVVTIHNDMYHVMDDQSPADVASDSRVAYGELSSVEVLTDEAEQVRLTPPETTIRNTESITSILGRTTGNATLPQLQLLPHLSHDGVLVDPKTSISSSSSFADHFSLELGGCKRLQNRAPSSAGTADDLFCDADRFG